MFLKIFFLFKGENNKEFMSSLLKLLQINLHAVANIDNYEGPMLPETVNIMDYQSVRPFIYPFLLMFVSNLNYYLSCFYLVTIHFQAYLYQHCPHLCQKISFLKQTY